MAVFQILGDTVLTKREYLERISEASPESTAGQESVGRNPLGGDFATLSDVDEMPGAAQFEPIGPNKPLTILIRYVYTGRHPRTLLRGQRPTLKDYSMFAASSRAVNFLENSVGPNFNFRAPNAFQQGTNVVAYQPAVVVDSLTFTVEMAFDRFPDQLMNTIFSALTAAAGIPLLIPAAGYLLAASSLLKIGSEWADALTDGRAVFSATDSLDFNIPGALPPSADFRVMTHGWDASGLKYQPGKGLVTRSGTPYDGDEPYVVVSLDGAERISLNGFAPTVATAGMLKQFFNLRDGAESSIEAILGALRLANDMSYREQAKALKSAIDKEPAGQRKSSLEERLTALQKNILNEDLKLK